MDRAKSISPYGSHHGRAVAMNSKDEIKGVCIQLLSSFVVVRRVSDFAGKNFHVPAKMLKILEDD